MEDKSILRFQNGTATDFLRSKFSTLDIESLIYEIRGQQVMLDSDLAVLYKCKNGTKSINLAVKRHINRFPERFMFQLTEEEDKFLRFQTETANLETRGGRSNRPYVFTEQGVAMLSAVLRTEVAEEVSIKIMDAFVAMRHYINFNKNLLPNKVLLLEEKVDNNTKRINELFDKFDPSVIAKDYIFFEGELYDAHSLLIDIFNSAKDTIIIIDNYIGKELLDILKSINKKITIVSKNIGSTLKKKYESQYNNIVFINDNSFHDRFIIIDEKTLYHCGASFKDLGKKCFAIHEIRDADYLGRFLEMVK